MTKPKIKVKVNDKEGMLQVELKGKLDETGRDALDRLRQIEASSYCVDLSELSFISSAGIHQWVVFLKECDQKTIILENCPAVFINQANIIMDMTRNCQIRSFQTDFYCEKCQAQSSEVFASSLGIEAIMAKCQQAVCKKCDHRLLLEVPPEHYFRFLEGQ